MNDRRIERVANKIETIKLPGYGRDEVSFLAETVFKLQPDFICEWGTNRGSSARILYESARLLRDPPVVNTVELPHSLAPVTQDHPGKQVGMFVRRIRNVHRYRGDGITVALDLYRTAMPERALFFVDGDHSPEGVERELGLIHKEAPNAVIVLHDTNHPSSVLTGPALAVLHADSNHYRAVELLSQAGMVRLWPKSLR